MAEYREIQGSAVQSRTSSTGLIEGEIWYDSSTGNFKLQTLVASSWASAPTLPGARQPAGQAGTQTAMVLAGGYPGTNDTTMTYDGTTWSAPGNNLNTARSVCCLWGIQGAAVCAGTGTSGAPYTSGTAAEEYNGTSWSNSNPINTSRFGVFAGGTLTQGVIAGGAGPSTYSAAVEEYDGTSFSSETSIPGAQGNGASGADLQTDMMCVGGGPGTKTTNSYYNGTSWTTKNSLSGSGRRGNMGSINSSSAPGFTTGGETATTNPITTTEEWDGTSFSSGLALPAATRDMAGADGGTGYAGLVSGGFNTTTANQSFEWTGVQVSSKTITTS